MITLLSDIPLIGPVLALVLPFLLVLGIVVFVHEYGHYIVGRWCGIHAEAFSLGFGPEIYGWDDSRGTRWKLSIVPLGGYVQFKGDADAASRPEEGATEAMSEQERRQTLQGAPIWARMATVAAGPFFNFILSAVIFATLALTQGVASDKPLIADVAPTGQAYGAGLRGGDEIVAVDNAPVDSLTQFFTLMNEAEGVPRDVVVRRDGSETVLPVAFSRPPVVATVLRDSAAERACLKPGDVILQVNGEPITQFSDLQTVVGAAGEEPLSFQIQRDADIFERVIQPKYDESVDPITGEFVRRPLIGITARADIGLSGGREQLGPIEAVGHGVTTIGQVITTTLTYLGAILDGRASGAALSGPIGIAKASAEAASVGLLYYVSLVALVSTAIGFLNLLPVPILDGGHLVFYSIEAVWGRPLPERWVGTAMQVGLALLLSLMVFATWNDISPSVTWVSDSLSGTAVDCDAGVGVQ